jgi:hypothetical protein
MRRSYAPSFLGIFLNPTLHFSSSVSVCSSRVVLAGEGGRSPACQKHTLRGGEGACARIGDKTFDRHEFTRTPMIHFHAQNLPSASTFRLDAIPA